MTHGTAKYDEEMDHAYRKALNVLSNKGYRTFIRKNFPNLFQGFEYFVDFPCWLTLSELGDNILEYCPVKDGKIMPQSVDDLMRHMAYINQRKHIWLK